MTFDLSSLNPSETAILRLLAGGHTIKSIAISLDNSEGAINERLRNARRKTGVGSSRELARIFAAQENRDDFPVIADQHDSDALHTPSESGARSRHWLVGGIVMLIALGIAVASYVGLVSAPEGTQAALDNDLPAKAGVAKTVNMMSDKEFTLKFNSELRDADWANATEKKLRESYERLYAQRHTVAQFGIQCRRTLCLVKANFAVPIERIAREKADETVMKTVGMWQLHVHPTHEGLKNVGSSLTTNFEQGGAELEAFWKQDQKR